MALEILIAFPAKVSPMTTARAKTSSEREASS